MTDNIDQATIEANIALCRERGVILPTIEELNNPELIPEKIREELKDIGLWEIHPRNLFRVCWYNEPKETGGLFGDLPNHIILPPSITGCEANIAVMVGKYFPTGAHKVGATYVGLVDSITRGEYNIEKHRALYPSTGNYARGGAFNSALLGVTAIAVLPEEMSKERFDWLKDCGAEIHATPGCESNVKEVYDKTNELLAENDDIIAFNQFMMFGNPSWHKHCTGSALLKIFESFKAKRAEEGKETNLSGTFFTTGSGGVFGANEKLKETAPHMQTVCGEALQCSTIYNNGFGGHRIEGIGDKHIPWVHNVRNTGAVAAIDDEDCMRLLRLFNEKDGHDYMRAQGVPEETISYLHHFGISSIANILGAIKTAKYYEMKEHDVVMTVATDSAVMYQSRLAEMTEARGEYNRDQAIQDFHHCLIGQSGNAFFKELTFAERKRVHNLKYYTWMEVLGGTPCEKTVEELESQWSDQHYWDENLDMALRMNERIKEFNRRTGLAQKYGYDYAQE